MTKIYCYNRCSTCKKALEWLDENGVKYEKIDIKTNHPDEATLRNLHKKSGLPLKRFFNTSGILYREMNLSEKLKTMSEDEQFKLLASDGMLVKRPILVTDSAVCVGFKEAEWKGVLG
ncbi:MAG: arsenate reductase family protein [Treponema sp.]|nr:arsenate reductase family protein [Treponema sp.]